MSFESCHIEYDLSRRQRLVAHFGVWAPYLGGLIVIGGGGTALFVALAVSVSPWLALLILLPLWLVRGFIIGLVNIIFVGVHHMDVIVEENGLGYATESDRLWIFLDGIIRIQKYSKDTWTISHHNGTVISIPTAAIEERYVQHMRKKMEWGKTPEGVQAVIDRGKQIFRIEAEARDERRTQRHNKPTGGERGELKGNAGLADQPRISPDIADPSQIIAALTAVRNRPPPKDPSSMGCIGAIVATVAITLLPLVARWTALSSTVLWGIGIALGVTVLGGGLLGIFGSGFFRGAVTGDAEEAIDQLVAAYPYGDPAILLQAAVRILDQSTVSTGPTTVETFDSEEVAVRLGDALAYVLQIERILLQQKEIYPCFTLLEPAFGDPEDET